MNDMNGADKESMSSRGSTVMLVYRDTGMDGGSLKAATSDDHGTTFGAPQFLFVPNSPPMKFHSPIVVLTGNAGPPLFIATEAYVAYIARSGNVDAYELRIARLTRTRFDVTWTVAATEVYRSPANIQINPAPLGWMSKAWRDEIPISFAVGPRHHLWLAFKAKATTPSGMKDQIVLADCSDTSPGSTCTGNPNSGWRQRVLGPTYVPNGGQHQPRVAVRDNVVTVGWYENIFNSQTQYEDVGIFSEDSGENFGSRIDVSPEGGNTEPCVSPPLDPMAAGYYGDYSSSVILPLRYPVAPDVSTPWIVTTFANSKAVCQINGNFVGEQHVRATVW